MKISFLRIFAVWRRFRHGASQHHADNARYLQQIEPLARRADPNASWQMRANWMIDLADWIRREPKVSLLDEAEWSRIKTLRIRYMLDWLDEHRDIRQTVQATLRKTLREATGPELFSATGLPRESAFFSELSERVVKHILPPPLSQHDLSTLFTAMFPDESDADWLLELDPQTLSRLWKLGADDGIAHGYRKQIDEAMLYLVTMVISVGISPAFRQRLEPRMPLLATPFMALRRELENYLVTNERDEGALRSVRMLIAVCQAQTDKIYAHLDEYGVSVGLVYNVERMRAQLTRVARLLDLRNTSHVEEGSGQVQAVLVDLIVAHHRRSSIRELINRSFSLLARKMVERNASHGEHYIASDRSEYRAMLKAALLGGFITAFTALAKVGITGLHLAHFFEGAFLSINYAASFLLITAIGGVLATKQPAVTAPALAAQMGELETVEGLRELLAKIAALLRSQAAAVFGNLLAVTPVVVALSFAFLFITGKPVMDADKAHASIASLSFVGITPLFAAFTGILLWLASLISGFADNWFALRRLKEAIAHHRRLVHALGASRAQRLADWLEHNISSIVANVSLAILLGMVPVIAHFFGLPLDVRHVTLSTATLAAAVSTLGWEVMATPQFWLACVGIVAIGLLNVGVAFACALALALRARDVPKRVRRLVFRAMLRRFTLTPYIFFWPMPAEIPAPAKASENEGEKDEEQAPARLRDE